MDLGIRDDIMLKSFKIGLVLCSLALGACSSSGGSGHDRRALSDYDDERQRLYDEYQNETLTLVSDVPDRGLGVYDGVGVIDVTSNGERVLRAIGDARVEYEFGNGQIDGTV